MAKRVQFEGQTHDFPDDATDEEIGSALDQIGTKGKVSQAIASVPRPASIPQLTKTPGIASSSAQLAGPASNTILNAPEESGLETGPLMSSNPKENQYDPIAPSMTDPTGRTLGREVNAAAQTIKSIPGALYDSVAAPITPEERQETGIQTPVPGILQRAGLTLHRNIAAPLMHAAEGYARGISPEEALNVAPEAVGQAAGNVVAAKGVESAVGAIPKILEPIRDKVPARLYNAMVGTRPKGFNYDRNPGRGVANEGLVAWSKDSMLDKIRGRQAQAGKAIDLHLSDPKVNRPVVNIESAINDPLNQMEAAAIKAKNIDLADRLADIRDRLNNDYARGPNGKLQPVGPSKLRQLTPLEANAIKQDIGEMTRWTGDAKADATTPAVQEVYRRINSQIEQSAPGIKEINKRYAEMKDAAESMDHKLRLGSKYNPLGSLSEILSAMEWGPVGYATTKGLRSTPALSVIGQAARHLPTRVPEPIPQVLGAAIAAPKEKKK